MLSLNYTKQKGVVLFVAMIALVVLMIAAVALIRSTDTAQMIAGNLAIKRDLTHESEQAIQAALANFAVGGTLGSELSRWGNVAAANYSSTVLSTNAYGVPYSLLNVVVTGETAAYSPGVTYRYVIDRMCPADGAPNLATAHCVTGSPPEVAIDAFNPLYNAEQGTPRKNDGVVYRISVRLTDARRTQSFFQTTLKSNGS